MTRESTNYFSKDCDAEELVGLSISNKQFVEKLVKKCKKFRDKLSSNPNVVIRSISEVELAGDGYTSSIYRIIITFTDNSQQSVVMKVLSAQKMDVIFETFTANLEVTDKSLVMNVMMKGFSAMHNRECDVYGAIADTHIFPLPQVFDIQRVDLVGSEKSGENTCGLIIMEDLSTNAKIIDICDGLNEAQARIIVYYFAKFHAYLLSSENCAPWRKLNGDFPFSGDSNQYADKMIDALSAIDPDSFKVPLRRLRKTLIDPKFREYCQRVCCTELELPQLLVHGDLWSNNLLWKTLDDGKISSELSGVIDWQLSFKGNFMVDFARMFATSFDFAARKELEAWIFEYYFDQLQHFLADRGFNEVGFPLENIRKAYELAKVGQFAMVIAVIPLLQKTYAAKFDASEAKRRVQILTARARSLANEAVEILERLAPCWLSE